MGVEQRYLEAFLGVRRHGPGAGELTPTVLAAAAASVLPVTAAGISLTQKLRVPLGWSEEHAAVAERQQTTLGDGPCLSVAMTGEALVADAVCIAEQWPLYYAELERRTPFRSVAAVPLRVGDEAVGAVLDLYAERSDLSSVLPLEEVEAVGTACAGLLFGMLEEAYYGSESSWPSWIDDQAAVDRVAVWTAVGMLIAAGNLDDADADADALARLRAFAYSHDLSLDETAARLVERRLALHAVLA